MKVKLALTVIATASIAVNIYLGGQLASLRYEQMVFDWKYFTCRVLLDDPTTAAIMKTKWKERRGE